MDNSPRLVIGANHDTIRAGHPNFAPKFEASLTIYIPLQDPGLVGYIVAFRRHLTMGDCF
jgi:hypothetical protein